MRGIARAAAYVPLGTVDGAHRAARDEDGFTLGATALERLEDLCRELAPPTRMLLVGDLPPSADADLVRFLGFPLAIERTGTGVSGLRTALASATAPVRSSEGVLVIAVDLDPGSPVAKGGSPRSDGAVALLIGERASTGPILVDGVPPGDLDSSTYALLHLGRERMASEPLHWTGDFGPGAGAARPMTASFAARPPLTPESPVSQGAYVPRPRYLENLPSRWRFVGERCAGCSAVSFPARGRCRHCGVTKGMVFEHLPRDGGEVVAATVIGPGGQPTEFDEQVAAAGSYGVVLLQLLPGVRVTLQVADASPGALGIGTRVATRMRRLYPMEGEWRYGRKAVPLP